MSLLRRNLKPALTLAAVACLGFVFMQNGRAAQSPSQKAATAAARGTFDVRLTPQAVADKINEGTLARYSASKQWHGDLEGTSTAEMLSAGDPSKGFGGYVAMERVEGTLGGRRGTLVLQHSGTLERGEQKLSITVVPNSGTGDFTGLAGSMKIEIAGGKHSYVFEYSLPAKP